MERIDGELIFSASDLINHLECPHLTHLDTEVALGRVRLTETRSDTTELVARKGDEHEQAYLAQLRSDGREVVEIKSEQPGLEGTREGTRQTVEAMKAGAEVIYQGVLFDGVRWRGHSDFLQRVESPSALGSFSYEVADTKLARRVKPYFLLQLCFYSELVEAIQGVAPERMHVVLGTRESQTFRVAEFAAYYRSVKHGFESEIDAGTAGTYPEPVEHCGLCRWEEHCIARRERDEHLSLVAMIQRSQQTRLGERGIATVPQLAGAEPADRPPRIGTATFERLRAQARLQVDQRRSGKLRYELLTPEQGCGFAYLPRPSEGDVFFDIEGDPFFDDGLEYLFGVVLLGADGPRFQAFWATDRSSEKRAFEQFIDFVIERLERFPDLHVYHYAAYEATAIKRLMGLHATREEEVDRLLRGRVLVDLLPVVRQGLRVGKPNYSLKSIEAFYMGKRDTEVAEGGDSIVAFEQYLETGDRSLLESIERYNEDDCRSTHLLREWLLARRDEAIETFGQEIPWRPPPEPWAPDPELQAELDALGAALTVSIPDDAEGWDDDQRAHWLMAQLIDYHRREAKPGYWAYFERLEADEEQLTEVDNEALGRLTVADVEPIPLPPPSRSVIHTLCFPAQEHKIAPGHFVDPATEKGLTVESIDNTTGTLRITRAASRIGEPLPRALIPGKPYGTDDQRGALRRLAGDIVERGLNAPGCYNTLRQILRGEVPSTSTCSRGEALQAGAFDLEDAKRIAEGLSDSYLFIQGPPGSGKTFTGAHLILHLIQQGHRVGVAAGSHAVIHNLLAEVEKYATPDEPFAGLKKCGSDGSNSYESKHGLIKNSNEIADFAGRGYELVAGTAWLFCREEMDGTLDYLFLDLGRHRDYADRPSPRSRRALCLMGVSG
ncbi:MAG TPA: TM0106 family RecB-like putative nuclease [Solirubrobacteraceae bacterium]